MNKNVLNEIINLKEKRRMLMAECNCNINEKTFSKKEMRHIKKHRHDEQSCLALETLNATIKETEEEFLQG